MRFFGLAIIALLFVIPVSAQDLNYLPKRVSEFWALRLANNKLDALNFVEPQSRRSFLAVSDSTNVGFKISGLEFTEDPNRIEVLLKVRTQMGNLGEFEHSVRDTWIWADGNWQWKAPVSSDNPFAPAAAANSADPQVSTDFQLLDTTIDFGRHVQGDQVEARLRFAATRNDVRRISPDSVLPGLFVSSPRWTSETEGYLNLKWDTALTWQDLSKELTLQVAFVNDATIEVRIPLLAQIDGRIAFKQLPELMDPAVSGQVELEITNLSKSSPLRIISAYVSNPALIIDEEFARMIEPGKTSRFIVRYSVQPEFLGSDIQLTFQGALPVQQIVFPLQIKPTPPAAAPLPYSREEVERALQNRRTPSLPRQ